MQYSVPQFVDIEDKVIGPLTIKQFLWLLGGSGVILVLWVLLPTVFAIIFTIPVVGISAAFAFYKVNGMTFNIYLTNLFTFAVQPKTRVWKRTVALDVKVVPERKKSAKPKKEKVTLHDVNLQDLVGIVDNELNPQARQKPLSNPIDPTPVNVGGNAPVAYSLNDTAYQSIPGDFSQQSSMPAESSPVTESSGVPLPTRPIPSLSPIKSIKPFRR